MKGPENVSTNTRINLMATALVAILFALGGAMGYFALGGQPTPSEAVIPASDTCLLCVESVNGGGGNGGRIGNVPSTPADDVKIGTGGSGGGTGN